MSNRQNPLYWSFGLGTWFGIRVRVSWLMPLVLVGLCLEFGPRVGAVLFGALLVSVLLHEMGHILAARAMDGSGDEILLWPFGGLAFTDATSSARTQIVTALGGPAVNLLLCGLFLPAVFASSASWQALNPLVLPFTLEELAPRTPEGIAKADLAAQLPVLMFSLNWMMLLINLLPVYPLDGGQVVRGWLMSRCGTTTASEISIRVAYVVGGILAVLAMIVFKHFILLGIAFLILLLAIQESSHLQAAEAFDDSFMGYDFSQGYTSLERSDRPKQKRRLGLLARWLEGRKVSRQRRLEQQQEQVEQQLDGILAKVHDHGMGALTPAERRLLKRASERFRSKDQGPS